MYVHGGLVNEEIGFHTTINLTGLSAPSSIFERFLGNRCQVVWKSYSWLNTMGEYLHSYTEFRTLGFVHVWTYQRRDGLSHYQNLTSLSAFDSILKDFRELTSISVKVILLVWHDKTLRTMATSVLAKRWTLTLLKIRQTFRRSVPFLKDFGEPMSVNVKVVLLV